jgi:PAS domain S-box-containing protein
MDIVKPDDYELERLKVLNAYEILDTLPQEAFDRFTKLASNICGTPISLVSLVDADRQWFKSKKGIDANETPRAWSFCSHAIQDNQLMEVKDATQDLRFRDNPLVTGDPNIRFYAGYPLIDNNGYALGTLCVIDDKPKVLNQTQKDALKLLTQTVVDLIEQQRKYQEVSNFNKLFEVSNDLICLVNIDGYFKKVNPAFYNVLGYQQKDVINKSIFDFIHQDDKLSAKNAFENIDKTDIKIDFVTKFRNNVGAYKSLNWVFSTDPITGFIFAVARDITQDRDKEALLKISESKFRAFFESSNSFMCTHDLAGNFISINHAGAEILGYKPEELLKKSLFDVVPKDRHQNIESYLKEINNKGKSTGVMNTKHKDGSSLIWIYNNVIETDADNNKYVIGNAVDISERYRLEEDLKNTKEKLEQTNKVANIGTWEFNLETQSIYWSEVTKAIHGVSLDYIPNLENAIPFFVGEHQKIILDAFNKAIDNQQPYDLELRILTQKGDYAWVRIIGNPEFKDGKCKRVYGTFQDITENYLYRIDLKRAKLQAEEANKSKSEFLASMSHEIRTPLNGVIGFTDLVLKTSLNQTQQQYLTIVNQSANSLLAIINDILDFSKIEAGKLDLDIEKSDLFEITSQAADIIAYQAQNKGLEVLLNIDPNMTRFAMVDSLRLKQVIVNLLGNAVKFTEKGEIELKVYAEASENDKSASFHFEVRDTGIGIKEEKLEKIFEAFSQEDTSTTKKYGGTGLGLTISNRLLGLMGSKLELKSQIGIGSTFYFNVNLEIDNTLVNNVIEETTIKKVLIVDDNDNNRLILKQMLLTKNIESDEASNGIEALQILSTGKIYDTILLDYHMPYMDGLETIEKIRLKFNTLEKQNIVLLHSSSDDEKIISTCEKYDVKLRMVKPIKMQDLFQKLAQLNQPFVNTLQEIKAPAVQNNQAVNILIAEDNLVNKLLARTVVGKILTNATIIEVDNGQEAVEKFRNARIDIILMDIQMPIMNGYQATEEIRKIEQNRIHTPIIALTAGNVKGEREKCLQQGMDDFVTKPFVEEDLIKLFGKWLPSSEEGKAAKSKSSLHNTHFNKNKLRDFMDEDVEIVKQVLNITIKEIKKTDNNLKQLLLNPDLDAINAIGHKLYGTASATGLDILADLAKELELLENIDLLENLYQKINKEIQIVITLMEQEINKI